MEDYKSMCEYILRNIETIFKDDSELMDFLIIPSENNTTNKSPVLYADHHLGLDMWCVKHIYRYAHTELLEVRKLLSQRRLQYCREQNINHFLIGVLLINPDVSTFWNMKRELVENDVLSVDKEFIFTKVVLSYRSKSNETFSYRRWMIKRILTKVQDDVQMHDLLQNELSVCEMAAGKSENNYHAWTHRIWCIETLGTKITDFTSLILSELDFTAQWISTHVSEHSGFHYRQYLMNLVKSNKNITTVLENYYNEVVDELGLVDEDNPKNILTFLLGKQKSPITSIEHANNLVNYLSLLLSDLYKTIEVLDSTFPNHESIWYHRRYLLFNLVKVLYEYHGLPLKSCTKIDDSHVGALGDTNIVDYNGPVFSEAEKLPKLFKPNKVRSSVLYQNLMKSELNFIGKNSTQTFRVDLAKRYEKWLKSIFCFEQV